MSTLLLSNKRKNITIKNNAIFIKVLNPSNENKINKSL